MIVRSAHRRPGMTLLEVMAAMAIFLVALTALTELVTIGSNAALDASLHADATRLAQSKLAEVEAGSVPPDSATSGTFDTEVGWQWRMDTTQAGPPNLYLVTVTVSREAGLYPHSVKLSQMVYDSRQMGKSGEISNPVTNTATVTAGGSSP